MGWNSWDAYALTITESQFRANVSVLRDKLLRFGYRYAVIDEGWYFENPQDRPRPETLRYEINAFGQYVPVPARFPSSAELEQARPVVSSAPATAPKLAATIRSSSFTALGDWVHAQGLLFGIHIIRGIPRVSVERNLPIEGGTFHASDAADTSDACPWDPTSWGVRDNAAGQAWYDALMRQYAAWKVDYLKVDCISDHPYKGTEIRMIHDAIQKTGRPMVLSLSPGPTDPAHVEEVSDLATMWRISDDVWDVWSRADAKAFPQTIKGQFDRALTWSEFELPEGRYADLDMLPVGELRPVPGTGQPRHTQLTLDEQRTLLTLWAMMRSPLIVGANLTQLDDATLRLLTNAEVLDIDQHSHGGSQIEPRSESEGPRPQPIANLRVWVAHVSRKVQGKEKRVHAAALFNLGDTPLHVKRFIDDLDLRGETEGVGKIEVYNVWEGRSLGSIAGVELDIPPHGVVLLESR